MHGSEVARLACVVSMGLRLLYAVQSSNSQIPSAAPRVLLSLTMSRLQLATWLVFEDSGHDGYSKSIIHTSSKGALSGTEGPENWAEGRAEAFRPRTAWTDDLHFGPSHKWTEAFTSDLSPLATQPSKTKVPLLILMGWFKYTIGFAGMMEFASSS